MLFYVRLSYFCRKFPKDALVKWMSRLTPNDTRLYREICEMYYNVTEYSPDYEKVLRSGVISPNLRNKIFNMTAL